MTFKEFVEWIDGQEADLLEDLKEAEQQKRNDEISPVDFGYILGTYEAICCVTHILTCVDADECVVSE